MVFVGRPCRHLRRPMGCPPFDVVLDGIGFFVGGAGGLWVLVLSLRDWF